MAKQRKGVYYLSRVVKGGVLDQDMLIRSILSPVPIRKGKHDWTFIETKRGNVNGVDYAFGKLSKYSPDAKLKFVEPDIGKEVEREEPNLSICVSPFVYIPSNSGLAFLHYSRHIPHWLFRKRFAEIIEKTNDNFFVRCTIEAITDMRTFAAKLSRMETIGRITALVHPSNPLFGPLWHSLRKYIGERNLAAFEVKEESDDEKNINTSLPEIVKRVVEGQDPLSLPSGGVPVTDAAILMAADGYGRGKIEGESHGRRIVIRTSETVRNFSFEREPEPDELAAMVNELLHDIELERELKH